MVSLLDARAVRRLRGRFGRVSDGWTSRNAEIEGLNVADIGMVSTGAVAELCSPTPVL